MEVRVCPECACVTVLGLFLTAQQTCTDHCPSATFANKTSARCAECSQGCVVCQTDQQCQHCRSGLYLNSGSCVEACQRCNTCFHFIPGQDGAALLYVSNTSRWYLKFSEGFRKVEYVSHAPPSVRPVRGIPRTVSAASSTTCFRTTPADRSAWKGFTPQTENAIAVQLTAEHAPNMASAQVRKRRRQISGEALSRNVLKGDLIQ